MADHSSLTKHGLLIVLPGFQLALSWIALMFLSLITAILVAVPLIANESYIERAKLVLGIVQEGRAVFVDDGQVRQFSKTYLFWTPDDTTPQRHEQHADLQNWLSSSFGGWTSWSVSGGVASGEVSSGILYQVSLDASKPDVPTVTLREVYYAIFDEPTSYLVVTPHFVAGEDLE
ncbi:MAG: hypothetical protein ACTS27_05205 [Phycisphaerales bacterium]